MTCRRASFNGGRNQAVDPETGLKHVEKVKFFFHQRTVSSGDIAGQRIGGLTEPIGQRFGDNVKSLIQPIVLAQQIGAVPTDFGQTIMIEVLKDRQIADKPADCLDLGVGHHAFCR